MDSITVIPIMSSFNMTNLSNATETPPITYTMTPQEAKIILAIALILDIVGIIGNSIVVFVIMKTRYLRERLPNQFIMNQSIIDFMSCVSWIFSVLPKKENLDQGFLDNIYCKLYLSNLLSWGLVFCSTHSLIALTVERYMSIVHPVWHKKFVTKQRAWVVMGLTWVVGLGEALLHGWPTTYVQDGVCYGFAKWPSAVVQMMAGVITCSLHYIIPMTVLIYCYGSITLVISGRIKKTTPDADGESRGDEQWSKAKRNVIHALILISILFAMCWSMNQIYYLMMCLGYPLDFSSLFYNITVLAVYMNSCVNPIVYFTKYDQFKKAARVIFCGVKVDAENVASSTS